MFTIKSFAAVNETSSSVWLDRATIVGFDIAYTAYGIHVALFLLCFSHLWAQRAVRGRHAYSWMAYISILFAIGSVANGIDVRLSQVIFVDNRGFPDGPGAFRNTTFTVPINIICTAACVIGGWLQDGLLLFRFYVILSPVWWVMAIPIGLFLVSIVMSCLLLAQLSHPGSTIWQHANINVELAYWSTSIATNILLTVLIVGYLIRIRRVVSHSISSGLQVPYLSVSTMLIESAALYTAFALAFLIPYAMGNTVNILFFSLIGQVQYIAPLLIILRVAQGRAYTREDITRTMSSVRWDAQSSRQEDRSMPRTRNSFDLAFSVPGTSPHALEKGTNILGISDTRSTSESSELDGEKYQNRLSQSALDGSE